MNLAWRLSRLRRTTANPPIPADVPRDPRVSELKKKLDALIARQQAAQQRPRLSSSSIPLPGVVRNTPQGELHVVENFLEPDYHHGREPIASALDARPETVARLTLDLETPPIAPSGVLFLDTETTGLSGGAGTIPFLIGLAWFEGKSLVIEQLLLRRPGEEAPMLARVAERLAMASALVTYNGKSFDWPLLKNRFVLNRVPMPELGLHLDLLHVSRRVFKRRLGSVRLVEMESKVLGFQREGDVDGHEIPSLYWTFVRTAEGSALMPVLEHNANDLIALAAIMGLTARRFETLDHRVDPEDQLGFAQLALSSGDQARAERFLTAAADGGEIRVATEARLIAAKLARRGGDHERARALLEDALGEAPFELRSRVHLALAKIYEHKVKDLERAIGHATETTMAEGPVARDRRVARLQGRLHRVSARKAMQPSMM